MEEGVLLGKMVHFAGHCYRAKGESIFRLLLWRLSHLPVRSRKFSFLDIISRDIGIKVQDMCVAMADRVVWKKVV